MTKKKISSVQFLRFIAFLFIFGWHIFPIYPRINSAYASFGVTFFVILSGFMMCYNYIDKIPEFNFKDSFKFLLSKIKKFYPLFIISSILPFIWSGTLNKIISLNVNFIISIIKYLLLLQVYFPSGWFEFNGVAWYLSLTICLYISSFLIFRFLKKIKDNFSSNLIIMLILIITLYFYIILFHNFNNDNYFLYICPIPRIFEFTIGAILCNIYKIFVKNTKTTSYKIEFTIFELFSLLVPLCIIKNATRFGYFNWSYIYIIPIIILIYTFSLSKGYISKLFSKKLLVYLGNLSNNLFMTHQVLITFLLGHNIFKLQGIMLALYIFILTLCFNILYFYIENKLIKRKK